MKIIMLYKNMQISCNKNIQNALLDSIQFKSVLFQKLILKALTNNDVCNAHYYEIAVITVQMNRLASRNNI